MPRDSRRTPREILDELGMLDQETLAALANGRIVDLHTPVDEGVEVSPIRRTDPEALRVIRHSAAHVMADAVQHLFPGAQVTIGPAIDTGFYYDFDRPDGAFTDKDLARIEKEMRRIIKENRPFQRVTVTRDEAKQRFESMGEKFKLEIIDAIPEGEEISIYAHGSRGRDEERWIDVCEGPHVRSTGDIGAVKLLSVAGAYWRGDESNPMLQRIYGTAFPSPAELEEHLRLLEEAKKRDHRKLGKELELFMFHEYAPAMPFLLPRGAFVYNGLIEYVRGLYTEYGYEEVITPQIFDLELFAKSGHLEAFRDGMYMPTTAEDIDAVRAGETTADALARAGIKPMNCPSHCLIFGQRKRSYRELPWRVADFGRLHRFERGGTLHGLTRVRSFAQDDAHIFCTPDQMKSELFAFNRLLFEVYNAFGFSDVAVKLALRPDVRVGTDEQWDRAERILAEVLEEAGQEHEVLPGEGAFYGPKLEFHVVDALGRSWQLGTIQVDHSMPERFGLEYIGKDGAAHRPAMLHRAIFGSIERFYGVYVEHVAGKFPVWLAPQQAVLVTVSEKQADYAEKVRADLSSRGARVVVDAGPDKLGAKIRSARLQRHPYIVVIGKKEAESGHVSPRERDAGDLGSMSVDAFAARLRKEARPPRAARSNDPKGD